MAADGGTSGGLTAEQNRLCMSGISACGTSILRSNVRAVNDWPVPSPREPDGKEADHAPIWPEDATALISRSANQAKRKTVRRRLAARAGRIEGPPGRLPRGSCRQTIPGRIMQEDDMTRILSTPEVVKTTGLSKTTIWRRVRSGDFPVPVKLGRPKSRLIGWTQEGI